MENTILYETVQNLIQAVSGINQRITSGAVQITGLVPIETINMGSTSQTLTLSGNVAYVVNFGQSSSILTLNCNQRNGQEKLWSVDISLNDSGSIQYGAMFDVQNCDALEASKTNCCIVRWDGYKAVLVNYKTY